MAWSKRWDEKVRKNSDFIAVSEFQVLKLYIDHHQDSALSPIFRESVHSDSFPHERARSLYKAINILSDQGELITESSLFREANKFDDSIDIGTIQTLVSLDVDVSSLPKAIEELKEGAIKYKLDMLVDQLSEKTSSNDPLDHTAISSLLFQAQDSLSSGSTQKSFRSIEDCLDSYTDELKMRRIGSHYPFHDTFLDRKLTKKAAPGQVILIAGSTGVGKSSYGLSLINGMINNSSPCIYVSLEMDIVSTMDRLLSMRTNIPVIDWYATGKDIDPLLRQVEKEKEGLRNKPFRFIDDPSIGLDEIQACIREFKMIYKVDYVCVFIDLITQVREFVDTKSSRNNFATVIEIAANQLHALSKKENVCFVCLAQMNRDADSQRVETIDELTRLRPSLNHIKNSNALGERARTVLSVFRRKYYAQRLLPEDDQVPFMPDVMEIQILKQSMGGVGDIGTYIFNGPTFSVTEIMPDTVPTDTTDNAQ